MNTLHVEEFCTLPTAAQPFRLMEFDALFRSQIRPPRRIDRHQVEFTFAAAGDMYVQVSDLMKRETACCSFFEFSITEHPRDVAGEDQLVLRVGVPASRDDVLEALTDRAVMAMEDDQH